MIRVDGHPVGLTVVGQGDPLVLLHGIGRDREDWSAVVPLLAEHFTVYAIDNEGFGESERWGRDVSLVSMSRLVRATLGAVGERRPVRLVGNSLGGAVALRVAADAPHAVAGLVLISPAGFGPDATIGLRLLTIPVVGPMLLALDASPLALHLRTRGVGTTAAHRELEAAAAIRLRRAGMRRQYMQVVHDLGEWSGIREGWRAEVLDSLAHAGIPTLVMWGDRDTVLPYSHLAAVQQTVPHAVAEPLPGLGHMPQLEVPDRIAARIVDFFAA